VRTKAGHLFRVERSIQAVMALHFRSLHDAEKLLVLPNVWDAVSARLFEEEGFAALGTTSAGVASAMGFPDGEVMSLTTHLAVARCVVERVGIPVSLDMERGYAEHVLELQRNVVRALGTGIVGVNLEDSTVGDGTSHGSPLRDTDEQCDRLRAVREAADSYGVPLVINARTDALLGEDGAGSKALTEAIERGNRYRDAGADCVFVPDMETLEERDMASLVRELDVPLNLIAGRRTPPVARLEEMGVSRLSFGPRPMRTLLSALQRMAREWRDAGTYDRMLEGTLTYETVNAWFRR
jgi:2-methylisocitrate lyase-like PEP mutase family enzyme